MYNATKANLASLILEQAEKDPDKTALVIPGSWTKDKINNQTATFGELRDLVYRYMEGLKQHGFMPRQRIVLMFPISIELYAVVIAILASGMTVVLIDVGMGRRKVIHSIQASKANAIISTRNLLAHRFWLPVLWKLKKFSIDSRGFLLKPFSALQGQSCSETSIFETSKADHALITFTSGSTGLPKGADRTQEQLIAQHLALREDFPENKDDIDMTCFPVVPLHNLCCGVTTVFPPVDLKEPGSANGALVFKQIHQYNVTRLTGAPAFMERLVDHLEVSPEKTNTIRAVGVGGAPMPKSFCAKVRLSFPDSICKVMYGSTEAEPISSIDMQEALSSDNDDYPAGYVSHSTSVAIVNLPNPLPKIDLRGIEPYRVTTGEIGEIIASGTHVNKHYIDNPKADRKNKIYTLDGTTWHRTGDIGYFDDQERIWLTGRLADIINHGNQIVYPLRVEMRINSLAGVAKSALVSGKKTPEGILIVEPKTNVDRDTLLENVKKVLVQQKLEDLKVRLVDSIPVDQRHNSKVDRPLLKVKEKL
jgi:acyl-CoA synthetase (AMP-forming)/AMP-acid ligase II